MNNSLKVVIDTLLDSVSQGRLAPIALKVAYKYNDDAVASLLNPRSAVEKDMAKLADEQTYLFASSDKSFVDLFLPDEDYAAIADEIAFNVVEGFNG